MPFTAPKVFGAIFCTRCGQRMRSSNHTCQPSAIQKYQRLNDWAKRSAASAQPQKKKK